MLTLFSHTLDETSVPENPTVLDVGCRNFQYTRKILDHWPKARVIAMDPDPIIVHPPDPRINYFRYALVGTNRGYARYTSFSTGEGNFLTEAYQYYDAKILTVYCVTIRAVMSIFNVKHWDVVKLDCECAEFEILENWPGPVATQISVEFHDYNRLNQYDDKYYDRLFKQCLPWYEVVSHTVIPLGPTGREVFGHWDTVLRLRK